MPELFHFTCDHRFPLIVKAGLLRPFPIVGTRTNAVWMTDLDAPNKKGLGLTSTILDCDRTEHQLRIVDPDEVIGFREIRKLLPRTVVDMLVWHAPDTLPMHWYLSLKPQKFEVVR